MSLVPSHRAKVNTGFAKVVLVQFVEWLDKNAAQQSAQADDVCNCADPKPKLGYFDVLLCSVCKSPRR